MASLHGANSSTKTRVQKATHLAIKLVHRRKHVCKRAHTRNKARKRQVGSRCASSSGARSVRTSKCDAEASRLEDGGRRVEGADEREEGGGDPHNGHEHGHQAAHHQEGDAARDARTRVADVALERRTKLQWQWQAAQRTTSRCEQASRNKLSTERADTNGALTS